MSDEKGGSAMFILLVAVCAILWSNQPRPKAELTPSPDGLIEQVAGVEGFLNHSVDANKMDNHSPGVGKMDDPKPAPSPSDKPTKPEIIIFTSPSCPPCEQWKRCEMQKFLDSGWKVVIVDAKDHSYPRTPTFLLTKDGKTVEKVGYFTFEQLNEVWK